MNYIESLLVTLLIVGCASHDRVRVDAFEVFPEKYRLLATELERKGEVRKALFSWQVVISFIPNDLEASERIEALQTEIGNEANKHFNAGLDYFRENSIEAARKEFVITLAYNPGHEEALHYLKYKLTEPNYILREVDEGDTLRGIAEEVYHDPETDFLIAYFNDLEIRSTLESGRILKLPISEAALRSSTRQCEEKLSRGKALFKAKKYQKALSMVEEITEYGPSNREAIDLRNASYYELGIVCLQKKDSLRALKMFKNVDITYRDVGERIAYLKKEIKDQAEIHYRRGVTYFLAEDLEKSADEWEKTLELDPEHAEAKRDLGRARRLLKKLGRRQ